MWRGNESWTLRRKKETQKHKDEFTYFVLILEKQPHAEAELSRNSNSNRKWHRNSVWPKTNKTQEIKTEFTLSAAETQNRWVKQVKKRAETIRVQNHKRQHVQVGAQWGHLVENCGMTNDFSNPVVTDYSKVFSNKLNSGSSSIISASFTFYSQNQCFTCSSVCSLVSEGTWSNVVWMWKNKPESGFHTRSKMSHMFMSKNIF